MAVDNKISKLVKNQFPDFYKEEGENFLAFVEAYYEYLEQNGKMTDAIQNLESYRDINTTLDEYLEYFENDLLPSVPSEVTADKRLLAKYIKYFNQSRGTLSSYKLLFRSLYNEEVEVNYPADQILKVSEGDWRLDRYLITNFDENTYRFIGRTVKGIESDAEALVEDVVRVVVRGRDVMKILLSNIKGSFNHFEPIRLLSDTTATGHTPIVEAGINTVEIITPGGQYQVGDVVTIISDQVGDLGKLVVTETINLGDIITFNLIDGGSGFTTSDQSRGTEISIEGGDGINPASFVITQEDIIDTFAISINTNLIGSNTTFWSGAPTVTGANGSPTTMSSFANVVLSSPNFGFPESGIQTEVYRDNANAVLAIFGSGNTSGDLVVGKPIYGLTSGANGVIKEVIDDTWFRVDTYRNFQSGESVKVGSDGASGNTVGTVFAFQANTIGHHIIQIGNTAGQTIVEGDEVVGRTSNAFGVIKKIISIDSDAYNTGTTLRNLVTAQITANTSANLTSQFTSGPMRSFVENEGLRFVGSNTTIGNTASGTSNTQIENIYTKLSDSLLFLSTTFGTISQLSLPIGGSGFSVAPTVSVVEPDIAPLGIGEAFLTLQSDDVNWGTGNSQIVSLDTNDGLVQSSTGAIGDVKGGLSGETVATNQLANGTYQTVVRVWQKPLQRVPGNINWEENTVTLNFYNSSYVPGTVDTRTPTDTGSATIVSITDRGILGQNANINASVGANGAITKVRVLDSGIGYRDNEVVTLETPDAPDASSATVRISLNDVANSEGFYATTRSHLDSKRGFIQDNYFYQEFSYQVQSAVTFDRYRDVILNLVHPSGQIVFGRYRDVANVAVDIVASANNTIRQKGTGTVSISNGTFTITGSGTSFLDEYSNNGTMIIEYAPKSYYKVPLNIVSTDTSANVKITWTTGDLSNANTYYLTGQIS